jgi:hypothetical protein
VLGTVVEKVCLECGCVLSRISTMRDEVIGCTETPVIEDNNLPGGHVCEVLSPVMSESTPTDEGETTEAPVVVVFCCGGGKVV